MKNQTYALKAKRSRNHLESHDEFAKKNFTAVSNNIKSIVTDIVDKMHEDEHHAHQKLNTLIKSIVEAAQVDCCFNSCCVNGCSKDMNLINGTSVVRHLEELLASDELAHSHVFTFRMDLDTEHFLDIEDIALLGSVWSYEKLILAFNDKQINKEDLRNDLCCYYIEPLGFMVSKMANHRLAFISIMDEHDKASIQLRNVGFVDISPALNNYKFDGIGFIEVQNQETGYKLIPSVYYAGLLFEVARMLKELNVKNDPLGRLIEKSKTINKTRNWRYL